MFRKTGRSLRNVLILSIGAAVAFLLLSLQRLLAAPSNCQPLTARAQFEAQLKGPLRADDPLVLQELRGKYLFPPSREGYKLNDFLTLYENDNFYWNVSCQLFIENRRDPVKEGFFVEAGALDGKLYSNTLDLEVKYNWTGLLIEPDKTMFRRLLNRHRKSWAANICLSPKSYPYEAEFRKLSLSQRHIGSQGWEDVKLSAMTSLVTQDLFDDRSKFGDVTFQSSQCFPVSCVLLALNVTRITLFSLDVEDAEWPILEQFPFHSVFVDVWMVEHRRLELENKATYDPEFVKWFESRGYLLFTHQETHVVDYVFVHSESPHSKITFRPFL